MTTEERKELIRTELSKPAKAKKKRKRGERPPDAKMMPAPPAAEEMDEPTDEE